MLLDDILIPCSYNIFGFIVASVLFLKGVECSNPQQDWVISPGQVRRTQLTPTTTLVSNWSLITAFLDFFNLKKWIPVFSVFLVGPLPESVIDACPVDITTTVELGTSSATVTWTEPIPTGIPVRVMLSSRSHSPGSFFPVGETTVLYLFEYGQSSTLSCLFVVTIETGKQV